MAKLYYKKQSYDFLNMPNPDQIQDLFLRNIVLIIASWNKDQAEFVLHTSGTTGPPQQLVFSREQLILSARQTISVFDLNNKDVLFLCLSPEHVAGFMMIIRALVGNMDLLVEPPSGKPLSEEQAQSPTFASFVPNQLFNLLSSPSPATGKLDKMKAILLGGGVISAQLTLAVKQISAPVFHTYGMTETLTHVAIKRINGTSPETRFKPLPGIRFEKGEDSTLIIHSPLYPGNPINTHDIVDLFPDNTFEFMGRTDHVINSGGVKIIPEILEKKLESFIHQFFHSKNFFVFGCKDEKLGERLELAVETTTQADDNSRENFYKEIKKHIKKYEIPVNIIFFDKFEYTELGKINKKTTIEKTKE